MALSANAWSDEPKLKKIRVIPVLTLNEVLANAFVDGNKTKKLLLSLKKLLNLLPRTQTKPVSKKTVA